MKKIYSYISAVLCAASLVSCNLDLMPTTAIATDKSMETADDAEKFRNGLYNAMKYAFTGGFVYVQDLQTDLYHAVRNFGNFQGEYYHYAVTASSDMANSAWYGIYSYISNANFLIEGARKLLSEDGLSSSDRQRLSEYYGEACYIRAHMYFNLTQYFCNDYDPSTASGELGVPVVTRWEPTSDKDKFPARNTLQEVYDQILADLGEAEKNVATKGTPLARYVTADVVKALQARVALTMEDWQTASEKASSLVSSGTYPLVSDAAEFAQGWLDDDLKEAIWRVYMADPTDLGNSFMYFIYNNSGRTGQDDPQYIPEDWVLKLFDKKNDIRYDAYFDTRTVSAPVVGTMTLMVKYPGNPSLYTGSNSNYVNMPKVFRISEMYLIAAEAEARMGHDSKASAYLNLLRKARISGWKSVAYAGTTLMDEIRNERVKELFGEGFRLNDLKRWHMGFSRSEGQDPALVMQGENYASCTRPADDPMFVWPIPTAEMEANPQMQQNEGYKNN